MAATTKLEAQRDALKDAINSGALSIQHGGKRIQYRALSDMMRALDEIEREIAGTKRKRVIYADVRRGY